MKRQQLVLQSLRSTLDPCTILPRIPSLISDLGTAFWTNLPLDPSVISSWVGLAEHITTGNLKSVVLDPSTSGAKNNVLTSASVTTIRNVVAHSLDNVPASSPGGGGGGGGGFGC
jgi:anionic cell wall polymer biosynthesis LytR-Cps2A-Psr (LCP) family protein